ncbi:MAG: glycosyltransferase family 1 protein [bacterium]
MHSFKERRIIFKITVYDSLICRSMVIGIDARFYGPIGGGGIGRYTKELIDNLEQIDDKNQFVIFLRRENWDDYNPTKSNFRKVLAPYKWYSWREQIFMPFKIWREKVDLMHFLHFNIPLVYVYGINLFSELSKLGWIRIIFTRKSAEWNKARVNLRKEVFVLTVHDLILLKYPSKKATTLAPIYFKLKFWAYKIVISAAFRSALKIIVPSQYVKNDIIKYFNVPYSKIEVIYEGLVDVNKINSFRENRFIQDGVKNYEIGIKKVVSSNDISRHFKETFSFAQGRFRDEESLNFLVKSRDPYILYVGNAYPHKNLERLIDAFAMILKNEGERENKLGNLKIRNLKLALVGVRNYFYERLEKYAEHNFYGIKDRIIFFGYATDKELAKLYKNATLYTFPSLEEGFGLPPLEAMSYGTPVVSSKSSCLPEILGDAVLYFEAENTKDMAEKILRGIEDEKLRDELIKEGYENIKKYDWQENAIRTKEIYGKTESL